MTESLVRKILVIGAAVLLVSLTVAPIVNSNVIKLTVVPRDYATTKMAIDHTDDWDIIVPDDYPTIQEAIDHAEDGYRILVRSGVYYENVVVYKRLDIIGEGSSVTIVDGGGTGDVMKTTSYGVKISGFTMRGGSSAGIHLASHYNMIQENVIKENFYGMELYPSTGNQIKNNKIVNNDGDGLWMSHSHENTIENNTISDNGGSGISANLSSLSNHLYNNTISNNVVNGITIAETSFGSTIVLNTISDNTIGIKTTGGSDNNLLFFNRCERNVQNAYDDSMNMYDNGSFGNYWDDYTGIDENNDGIGDTPYDIPGGENQDMYPLISSPVPPKTPNKPECLDCPGKLELDKPYTFHFNTSNPIFPWVWYHIDWDGDKIADERIKCLTPAEGCDKDHAFSTPGTYNIRVKAESPYEMLSDWSPPLKVITKTRSRDLVRRDKDRSPFFTWRAVDREIRFDMGMSLIEPIDKSLTGNVMGPVVNINTSEQFDSIQDAIDDSDTKDGHWITVAAGIYYENVYVHKSVWLIGADKETTFIDGCKMGSVVEIVNSSVNITGFTITNGSFAGLEIFSDDNTILKNRIASDWYGILLRNCTDNNILDNDFVNCSIVIFGDTLDQFLHNINGNIVNGASLCYYKNQKDIDVPSDCGCIIIVNCSNVSIHDIDISNVDIGATICNSSDFSIKNPVVLSNNDIGIWLINSYDGIIESIDISSNNWGGIAMESCENISLKKITVSLHNGYGIWLDDVSKSTIQECTIDNNDNGIRLFSCTDLVIKGNNFIQCSLRIDGELLEHFIHEISDDNTVNDGKLYYRKNQDSIYVNQSARCVIIVNCFDIYIKDRSFTDVDVGVELAFSRDAYIEDSTMSNNDIGIYFYNYYISSGSDFVIENNVIEENKVAGILIRDSSDFEIRGDNQIISNYDGIRIENSNDCIVAENILQNNNFSGFFIEGSMGNIISGNNISFNHRGIDMQNSIGNSIDDNILINNDNGGISIFLSDDNNVINNQIIGLGVQGILDRPIVNKGIWMERSSYNDIISNVIYKCWGSGLHLVYSSDNLITRNSFCSNYYHGVRIEKDSNRNVIYNNYFAQNYWFSFGKEHQAFDDCSNIWNLSYYGPEDMIWGNCWEYHRSPDDYKGENQDVLGSDGVVDNGYPHGGLNEYMWIEGEGGNIDFYPRRDPVTAICGLDIEEPEISIIAPAENYLYIRGIRIWRFLILPITVCLGNMKVRAHATDDSNCLCVEFYLYFSPGDDHRYTDYKHPYTWNAWGERLRGGPEFGEPYRLEARVVDGAGNTNSDFRDVFVWCSG